MAASRLFDDLFGLANQNVWTEIMKKSQTNQLDSRVEISFKMASANMKSAAKPTAVKY